MTAPTEKKQPRDSANWAGQVSTLSVPDAPTQAVNLVEGRHLSGPLQGFGPMWQKTYSIQLNGLTLSPAEVVMAWKENFPRFWPPGNNFYGPITGLAPGEVALLSMSVPVPGTPKLSTGVMVLYADDESFTFMTPEGHMFAGWITFSAYERGGAVVAQAQVLMRSADPILELTLRMGGHRQEDKFWQKTLQNLARHLGAEGPVETQVVCVDPRIQWSQAKNIKYNVVMRSTAHMIGAPVRWVRGRRAR
ncbi:MAG TPA: hypothetical protein VFR15_14350 [Chloroflexia bacterium]|nr:hypothetical protein [Chloroflexia bacterium]